MNICLFMFIDNYIFYMGSHMQLCTYIYMYLCTYAVIHVCIYIPYILRMICVEMNYEYMLYICMYVWQLYIYNYIQLRFVQSWQGPPVETSVRFFECLLLGPGLSVACRSYGILLCTPLRAQQCRCSQWPWRWR